MNKFEEIRKKVQQTSIHISTNLREEDKTRFIQFADSQFKGDYGISLRWLLDCAEGYFMKPDEVLKDRIDVLSDRIAKLEIVETPKEEKPKKTMLSGKKI